MRDADVRRALVSHLYRKYKGRADCAVVEELDVWHGTTRIDVAVINGALIGYEIKSERDTLSRLEFQSHVYSLVFDKVTLIAADKHLREAQKIVPDWWGLKSPRENRGDVTIPTIRSARRNRDKDLKVALCFLNKHECISILDRHLSSRGLRATKLKYIHEYLASNVPNSVIQTEIRECLRSKTKSRNLLTN